MAGQDDLAANTYSSSSFFSTLFALAFRPFFLASAAFSAIAIALWMLLFTGKVQLNVYGGLLWWHQHEMLFGFAAAVVVGFLLTAVQTWTGLRSLNGPMLAGLFMLWLLARVLMLFPSLLPGWLVLAVDLSFLPLAALALARLIYLKRMWRNLMFVPILLLMTWANAHMHCAAALNSFEHLNQSVNTMVLLISLLMCVIGGRVFPMFTANATATAKVLPLRWLEFASLLPLVLLLLASLGLPVPATWLAYIYMWAGIAHCVRASRWKPWITLATPLLWSLHFSYWAMALAFLGLGLSEFDILFTRSSAMHGLTVGGMAFMILSMIARVSLGHTGREIKVGWGMSLAFILMLLAYLSRAWLAMLPQFFVLSLWLAAGCWVLAFVIFVIRYWPILTSARVDGKLG
ncbi:NnrS family protein [Agaribacterium haliotis]|uniref:NnrS family protein n=1 Tax=Agaribacterium haliotis TaxID=2013869 RepID=UPI000BB54C7C|nr:NnrS family protein [Agaribacterium haliotis]